MRKTFGTILLLSAAFAQTFNAQVNREAKSDLSAEQTTTIIKKFSENESAFREALKDYVFIRKAVLNTIGLGGQVTGTYRRDSFLTFASDGSRFEKLIFMPVATTPPGFVTPQDLEDLGGINPFALEPFYISQYNFAYAGIEKIDELKLYVFDVTPKVIPNPKKSDMRLFTGRIWVDVDDLMIVKTKGKALPETKQNKFPVVETTRGQVDGKYWFPLDARSDDELIFDDGAVVKINFRVKFLDYKLGRTDVRILDDVIEDTPAETPKKP